MRKIVDNCVDCTSMGLHCLGASCSNRRHEVSCCDNCGAEETLYDHDGKEYCSYCLEEIMEAEDD